MSLPFVSTSNIEHYKQRLGLTKWAVTRVGGRERRKVEVNFVEDGQVQELVVKTLANQEYEKAVVVAKSVREAEVYGLHLQSVFPGEVLVAASGGAGKKALYSFKHSEKSILVVPPRGQLYDLPWPEIDLAIIPAIPFSYPDPLYSFTEDTLPKTLNNLKKILNKLVAQGLSRALRVYILDRRLVQQSYGRDFCELIENLCGEINFIRN